jgi:hypothetical protein
MKKGGGKKGEKRKEQGKGKGRGKEERHGGKGCSRERKMKRRMRSEWKEGRRGTVPVASACNPSYSGGTDQEDCSSKPAWANSSQDPISKIPNKKGLVVWL